MSSRNMNLDVLVRLRDKLTGPLKRLRDQLKSLMEFSRKLGMLGAAIAAISFMGPIKEAAAFQQKLLDIAGTTNVVGAKAFQFTKDLRSQFEALALVSGQFSDTIAQGYGGMVAAGVDTKLIDASLFDIAKATTAVNAEFDDMTKVATSLLTTLRMPASQLKDSLGGLVVAGRLGSFELKDMAKEFSGLTSQMVQYGVTGREAVNFLGAALQIAHKGTATPTEAANNLKNFLSKIKTQDTIKNFKDMGVDIQAVMQDAAVKGINPIEAVLKKIVDLTAPAGGDIQRLMKQAKAGGLDGAEALAQVREQLEKIHGAGKLGKLFGDQQVMDFLLPFLANVDEFKDIYAAAASATGDVIDPAFKTQMEGLNAQLRTFQELGTQAGREIGFAFGELLPEINANLQAGLTAWREWNKETGGLGSKLLTFGGAGIIAATAIGAIGFALPVVAAGLGAMLALLSPIGIGLAAVAAAGVLVWKNWGTIGPRMLRLWDGIKDRAGRLVQAGRDIGTIFGPRVLAGLSSAWNDLKGGWSNIKGFFEEIRKAADIKFDWSGFTIDDVTVGAIKAIGIAMDGIRAGWNALKDFGSGFAPHLKDIGKSIGGSVKAFKDVGDGLWRIGSAVTSMMGLDTVKLGGFFKTLGGWAGNITAGMFDGIRVAASTIAWLVQGLARLTERVADLNIDWSKLNPATYIVDAWTALAGAISSVKAVLDAWTTPSKEMKQKVSNVVSLDQARLAKNIGRSPLIPGTTDNILGKSQDDRDVGLEPRAKESAGYEALAAAVRNLANVVLPKQQVEVKVQVDGPGKVTGLNTGRMTPNTGARLGRV